jgi:mono/diheme cytochrome c family protein
MKAIATALALVVGLAAVSGPARADAAVKPSKPAAKVADGSPVFLQYKCNSCHTIEAKGIKKAVETPGAASKPPDLSGVGAVRKAEWMSAFLLKEEKLDGKLHIKKFRGTDAELKQLVDWLATLDDAAAAKKLKESEEKNAAPPSADPK